jgi:TonB family protein
MVLRTYVSILGLVSLAVGSWHLRADQQAAGDSSALLNRPVSPGTIALLAEYPTDPAVKGRLVAALTHAEPDVRAAAARVIFVQGMRDLVPGVAEVFPTETSPEAAFEESRVLLYFGGPSYDIMVESSRALRGTAWATPRMMVLAGARGEAVLNQFAYLQGMGASESELADFIRVATRGRLELLSKRAVAARQVSDASLLAAVLRASRDADAPLGEDLVEDTIKNAAQPEMRRAALWHLIELSDKAPLSDRMRTLLKSIPSSSSNAEDAQSLLANELAARAGGRAPRKDAAWTTFLASPPPDTHPLFARRGVTRLLSERELDTIGRSVRNDPKWLSKPADRGDDDDKPRAAAALPFLRAISEYPHGFVSGVFAASGCDTAKAWRSQPGAVGGDLRLRADGRPMHLAPASMGADPACAHAARVLLMTYTPRVDRVINDGQPERLIVPFSPDYIACQDTDVHGIGRPVTIGGRIAPPSKLKDVRPEYPRSAQTDKVEGTVLVETTISGSGCIARAAVTRSVDIRLEWASIRAVIDWRFTPTLLNGTPVPVLMTLTTQFTLQ